MELFKDDACHLRDYLVKPRMSAAREADVAILDTISWCLFYSPVPRFELTDAVSTLREKIPDRVDNEGNAIKHYKPCITIGKLVPVRSHMAYLVPVCFI